MIIERTLCLEKCRSSKEVGDNFSRRLSEPRTSIPFPRLACAASSKATSKGHVRPVSFDNASSPSLKKSSQEMRLVGSLPPYLVSPSSCIAPCEYRGPLFRNSEDSSEVLRLLRGIDVPVTDVGCTNQGVGYPRTFTARHEVEDPTVPSTTDPRFHRYARTR